MTKEFAMLQASRQLEGYLAQERYNLNRMNLNDNVSNEFLAVKVDSYNGLVTTLNHLFTVLTGVSSPLFERYSMEDDEEMVIVPLPSYVSETIAMGAPVNMISPAMVSLSTPAEGIAEAMTTLGVAERVDDSINDEESGSPTDEEIEREIEAREAEDEMNREVPNWVADGYASYESWVADKELETAATRDDADVVVDVGLSKYRVDKILTDYSESTEQDIDTYVPEDDVPVSVFPSETPADDDGDPDRSTRDLRYLNHTADNTLLDTDPAQITRVTTAVEREGVDGSRGPAIDIDSYSYQPSNDSLVDSLITDELNKLRKTSING